MTMAEPTLSSDFAIEMTIPNARLAAVIPALNEGQSIVGVVSQLNQCALAIVVDDGSNDDTAIRARSAGAFVVTHPVNRGYDAALETGIRTAIVAGCSFAITMDADGQHDPSLFDRIAAELDAGADLVVGTRDSTQRWSEVVFGCVSKYLWGVNDPLCGMKGYRLQVFNKLNQLNTYSSIGTELTIRAAKSNLKIIQIPIRTRPRIGQSRFGSGFKANIRIMKALLFGMLLSKPFDSMG